LFTGTPAASTSLHQRLRQTADVTGERVEQRVKREHQRALFDDVAALYDATRQSYPSEVVDATIATASVGPGASVLEIGCGTGQLTRGLAGRGFTLTAIDIGAAMIAAARRNVADPTVRFEVSSFEDLDVNGPLDLIVSATAFHWVDPAVGWAKAARLLRPNGWLALLTTGERYREPLRTSLRELWTKYSREKIRWTEPAPWTAPLRESPLFGEVVEAGHQLPLILPADTVLGVECTRATFLSYDRADQEGFVDDLTRLLAPSAEVELVQETFMAMARVTS
jgi:ubiquinone/menaquinone biosynthesis C-methylase UbiE